MRQTIGWLAALALVAAACGDSGTPTTVAPPTAAATTTAPPGTTTPATTGTTVPPATTQPATTAVPGDAAAVQVNNCIVGVDPAGGWLRNAAALAPYQPFAGLYRFVRVDRVIGLADARVVTDVGEEFAEFSFTEGGVLGYVDHASGPSDDLLVSGGWDPTPRAISFTDPASEIYAGFTADVLEDLGLDLPPSNRDIVRFDIEGDGKEEVLVNASNVAGFGTAEAGLPAYSAVYLRRLDPDDNVETSIVASSSGDDSFSVLQYELAGVFDANGDGDLELAFNWLGFESSGTTLYEFDGTTYRRLANCGSGV